MFELFYVYIVLLKNKYHFNWIVNLKITDFLNFNLQFFHKHHYLSIIYLIFINKFKQLKFH